MKIEELRIPAPWGHIAAKAWGETEDPIVVAVHGILENAGSFDTLIPMLPEKFYYVCIELPGHGFSSNFPKGYPAYYEFYHYPIKITMDYFKKDTYILMGHSFGATLATFVTQLYQDLVSKLILLDTMIYWTKDPSEYGRSLKKYVGVSIDLTKNQERKAYSYEEIKNRMMKHRIEGRLTSKAADNLLKRMIRKVGENKYEYTYDENLATMLPLSFHQEDLKTFLKKQPVRCEAILIHFTETSSKFVQFQEKFWNLVPVQRYLVKGHHNYHTTNPEIVAPIISEFLLKEKCKL